MKMIMEITSKPTRKLGRTCRCCFKEGEVWVTLGTDNSRLAFCLCAKCAHYLGGALSRKGASAGWKAE